MKTLRSILGFTFILIILSGAGYIGWFVSEEGNISWPSIMKPETVENAHSQHASTGASSTKREDVNPVESLQVRVSSSYKSIQQVAELMTSSSVNPLLTERYQRGLYSLSEGVYLMNQLDQNMNEMVRLTDSGDPTYQVYANRHNVLVKNQMLLNTVAQKLSDAKELFLSNVTMNTTGDSSAAEDVQGANKAIYQMAQAVMELESTNLWLEDQINQTMVQAEQAQQAADAMAMEKTAAGGFSIDKIQMPALFTMIPILFAVLMLIGIIGATRSLMAAKPQKVDNEQTV
ncbi:hypothetical protein [Paenibacillus ihuae]|uniref:hypothetical protein n=1 Tax=Paenibacillus ihuae TaxID=1232431 RepID=UPI0006D59CFF|nr:hypothetical protein [Paenibacillus ihuae]